MWVVDKYPTLMWMRASTSKISKSHFKLLSFTIVPTLYFTMMSFSHRSVRKKWQKSLILFIKQTNTADCENKNVKSKVFLFALVSLLKSRYQFIYVNKEEWHSKSANPTKRNIKVIHYRCHTPFDIATFLARYWRQKLYGNSLTSERSSERYSGII